MPETPEEARLAVICEEMRKEIQWQGAEFDQIDAKMGVALGFVLISAGQLLASLSARLPDGASFLGVLANSTPMHVSLSAYLIGLLMALCFGIMSRWPRPFRGSFYCHSDDLKDEDLARIDRKLPTRLDALLSFEGHYRRCLEKNREVLYTKDRAARFAYAGVTLCLLALGVVIGLLLMPHLR